MRRAISHPNSVRRVVWQIAAGLALLFVAAPLCPAAEDPVASVRMAEQAPSSVRQVAPGTLLLDFGRVAFGNLLLPAASVSSGPITVRFGEALSGDRIDRSPPGSVRYAEVKVTLQGGAPTVVAPPADVRNTTAPAVLTAPEWGVVLPFRWVEIDGLPSGMRSADVRRRALFDSTWVDGAGSFSSSDPMLNRIWELCHYSIKATTFAGIFVDGDRERLAYEADAYLDQLGYYDGDADPRMPRATFERLLRFPTWPTEWTPHMVFIAYADWMETGDRAWLAAHYEALKGKLLSDRVGTDGLVHSTPGQMRRGDLVDWPQGERDGYVFREINTVVNAFRLRALLDMAALAQALGKADEARTFAQQESVAADAFNSVLFDPAQGLYRDGVGTDHTSAHANLFPLAFGLVPQARREHVAQWLASRGMPVSVYAAQYLLEGLFANDQSSAALALMAAPGDRSWRHMVDSGATLTWEAWDQHYKPNQDWNHAWGAAPANLLPRFVLGAQPAEPGWSVAEIAPHPGSLQEAHGTVPTPLGELKIGWRTTPRGMRLQLALPGSMQARVRLPAIAGTTHIVSGIASGGKPVAAHREGNWWVVNTQQRGNVELEER